MVTLLLKYEKIFKGKTKTIKIKFSKKEIDEIIEKLDKKLKSSIDIAFNRIKQFH